MKSLNSVNRHLTRQKVSRFNSVRLIDSQDHKYKDLFCKDSIQDSQVFKLKTHKALNPRLTSHPNQDSQVFQSKTYKSFNPRLTSPPRLKSPPRLSLLQSANF